MSWVRIWVHLVFSTKNRNPVLFSEEKRRLVFQHIKQNADVKKLRLDCVNGYQEHAHCLISLNKEISISKVAQLIKGESAHWVNENNLLEEKLVWQDDYYAVSVSESHLQSVREYIHNQEGHHGKKSFNEEMDEFLEKYGWSLVKGNK